MDGLPASDPDLYVGISGVDLESSEIDFGQGIILRSSFAHVFSTDVLGFARPVWPSKIHPGPWQASSRRPGIDITAELQIPATYKHHALSARDVAFTIVTLLRLWSDPTLAVQILADRPIEALKDLKYRSDDHDAPAAQLLAFRERTFDIGPVTREGLLDSTSWVVDNWEAVLDLRASRPEFELAVATFENAQYIPSTAMMLVSLWGALEAVFSSNSAELRFRVSTYIAAYLEPRGEGRLRKQREVAKLYDARSAAAHGTPKHCNDDLLKTFELLRHAILRMIDDRAVPTKDDLDRCLFLS